MTKAFRYGLNQIPYDTEVMNRFKELYLVDRVPKKLRTGFQNVQEAVTKTSPKKKNSRRQSDSLRRLYT